MLEVRQLSHRFGEHQVLRDVSLGVAPGEIVCLLGASGSGKSTLLRIVAGLEAVQSGELGFDGSVLAAPGQNPPPESRGFGLVFQDHVLFPHLSVEANVAFGLDSLPADQRRQRVQDELAAVGLADLGKRYPHTLSGGQQQRVAVARALATRPRLMLLDEPFASVDSTRRRGLREDTRRVLKARSVPAIVVTHDAHEAMELADRIAVIDAGRIVQYGSPAAVWARPANRFVAELFCDTDSFDAQAANGELQSAFGSVPMPRDAVAGDASVTVVVRPEAVKLNKTGVGDIRVVDRRFLGQRHLIVVASGAARLRASFASDPGLSVGDAVSVDFEPEGVFAYNRE